MGIDRYEAGIIFDGKNPVIGFAKEDDGDLVSYKQYLESHAYDEAKERDLFELQITKIAKEKNYHFMKNLLNRHAFDGSYLVTWVDMAWLGWSECAKSRARSAE